MTEVNDDSLVDTVQRTAQQLSERELNTDVVLVYFTHAACLPCRRLSAPLTQFFTTLTAEGRVAVTQLDVTNCKAATLALVGVSHLPCALFFSRSGALLDTLTFSDIAKLQLKLNSLLNTMTDQGQQSPVHIALKMMLERTETEPTIKRVHSIVALSTNTLAIFGDDQDDQDDNDDDDDEREFDVKTTLARFVRVDLETKSTQTIECSGDINELLVDAIDVSFVLVLERLHAVVVARSGWHVLRWRRKFRRWSALLSKSSDTRRASAGVSFCGCGNDLYAFGGLFESGEASSELWRAALTRDTVSWHVVPQQTTWPLARGFATLSLASATGLLLCGGDGGEPNFVEFGDAWLWQLDAGSWCNLSPMHTHAPRMKHSAAIDSRGNAAWLIGGESDFEPLEGDAACAMFDLSRRAWRSVALDNAAEAAVMGARVSATGDGRVWVVDRGARQVLQLCKTSGI